MRVWRRPRAFDARRGELGSYLRLMARSRALDLWREAQAAGRASDRLKLVVADDEGRVDERPSAAAERDETRDAVRDALRRLPEAQREALVLAYWGGLTADQIALRSARAARHREEPHPARHGQAARGVQRARRAAVAPRGRVTTVTRRRRAR